jgi:hypothetical protein
MSVAEAVLQKLRALPPIKQEQVLRYVESLQPTASVPDSKNPQEPEPHPWIEVALSLNLDGPPDWSDKFEDYLNGDRGEARP